MSGRYNWDARSHRRLYDDIHGNGGFFGADGAGVSGAQGSQEGWAELAALMARARERTEAALSNAGAVWEGGAADAMRSGITPLAQWAADAHIASIASQQSTDRHVDAYSSAKHWMPEPVPVTSTANSDGLGIPAMYTHLLGGQTDQDKQEAAAQEAKAEAVRVMSGYEANSAGAQASVGRFVPPPSVTVAVSPPRPTDSDGIPIGVREWPGTGRIADDSRPAGRETTESGHAPGAAPPSGGAPPPAAGAPPAPGATTPSLAGPTPASVLSGDPYRPGTTSSSGAGAGDVPSRAMEGGHSGRQAGGGGHARREAGSPRMGGDARGVAVPVSGSTSAVAGARGAAGLSVAPVAGRSEGDDDTEHLAAEYLRDFHDGFWDDAPPVSPAVIGLDED